MFSHIMLGTNDIERSKTFYDAVLGTLGVGPGHIDRYRIFWRTKPVFFRHPYPSTAIRPALAMAAPLVLPVVRQNRYKPGTRQGLPMAAKRLKILRESAKVLLASFILPICATQMAIKFVRFIGCLLPKHPVMQA